MYKEEVIIKILGKATLAAPEIDQRELRYILEEVLYNYELQPMCNALVVMNNLQDKVIIYLASKKLDGLSDTSLYNYKLHLVRFSYYMQKNVEDINTMDIRVYLATLSKQQKLKNTSLATEISILKSFFTWLENEEYILKSPMRKIKQTKIGKRLRNSLNLEELERLRYACTTPRQRGLLEFVFSTGARLSEIVDVDLLDINWSDRSLNVIGKGNKERTVYFSAKAKLYLTTYLGDRINSKENQPLFITSKKPYGRIGKRTVEREIATIGINAGFEKSIFPHLLRHTMATLALKSGASLTTIQKLLGHNDPAVTEIYAEIDDDTVKHEYKKYLIS